jgi:predicted Zn-dependent peptidase
MTRKLREVTPDQVRAVARKYLVDDKLTVAILDPQPMAEIGEIGLIKPGLVKTDSK